MSIIGHASVPSGRAKALLRLSGFRRLLGTRLLSQLSDGIFQVSLASYVVFSPERQPTAGSIASAFAVLLLPFCLFGPFAGVLLDRWRRRQILLYGNLIRLLLCAGTAWLVLLRVPTPVFFTAALLVTGVNRFILAGLSAALPQVVRDRSLLVSANAIAPTMGTVATTIGGGAAFIVRLFLPAGPHANAALLVLAGLGYGSASLASRTMSRDELGPERGPQARQPLLQVIAETTEGLVDGVRRLVRDSRPATYALAALTTLRFCYGLLLVLLLMLCRNTFATPSDQSAGIRWLGLALAASAAGFFTAAVVTPWATRRVGVGGWLVWCAALAAVLTPALGLLFAPIPIISAAYLLGLFSQGAKISTDTIVQTSVADFYRGRVFSVYDVLFNGSLVAAAAVAAALMPSSGRSVVVIVMSSLLYALTALAYGLTLRHSRPSAQLHCPVSSSV
ncbi:MFS transporter [Streptacidiphilus sp. P02-A3a]|uniref:MFS transporter n=1 Tax=Streptacidiphilus sp. P02-A3a TaxID=2704468 RepID=UPI001CDC749C|nr:MFS transporter [Streptacidiphilus sp. P02-A3a]